MFTTSCGVAAQAFGVVSGAGSVWADGSGTPWTTVPTRWRIGVPQQLEWFGDADGPSCFDAARSHELAAAGAEIVPIDLDRFLDAGRLLYGSALVADRAAAFGAVRGRASGRDGPDGPRHGQRRGAATTRPTSFDAFDATRRDPPPHATDVGRRRRHRDADDRAAPSGRRGRRRSVRSERASSAPTRAS